jgi:putative DNA primase/helicase
MTTPNGTFPEDVPSAVRLYLERGHLPIPVYFHTKKPIGEEWEKQRPTIETLNEFFPPGESRNVGILLGEPSGGLIDIDLDAMEAVRAAPYLLPPTAMVNGRPGKPSSHWWYRVANPPQRASEKYKDLIRPANPDADDEDDRRCLVELRSTGGQTVVPPSIHDTTGERLVWHSFGEPARVELEQLHRSVRRVAAASLIARYWPPRGVRHELALAIAGGVLRAGWSVEEAEAFVRAVCMAAKTGNVDAKVKTVQGTKKKLDAGDEHVTGWTRAAELMGEHGPAVVRQVREWLGLPATAAWTDPQPIPASLPTVAPFDFDLLPEAVRGFVSDVAERMQCPPDFPAVATMVALAGAVGKKLGIRPKRHDDWLVVPNLWGGVVGRPGILKSPSIRQPMKFLHRLEIEGKKRYEAELREYEEKLLVVEAQKKAKKKAIETAARKGQDALAVAREFVIEEPKAPVLKRYLVNDSTVEKLGELLNLTPVGLTVFRDELTGLFRQLDKEGQEGARAFYLEAWDGLGSFTYDRIGRGTIYIESVTLSLFGSIQPGRLLDYLGAALKGGAGDDGLMQRLQLLVYPDVTRRFRNVDRWPDTQAKQRVWEVSQRLDTLDPAAIGAELDGDDGVAFLHFTPEAQGLFDDWRVGLEEKVRSGDEHPAVEAHLAKYRSLVPTLALLIHLADGGQGAVGEEAMSKALRWAAYLESHARRIYAIAINAGVVAGQALAKRIEKGELADGFTLREVYRRHWAGLCDKQAVEQARDLLLDLGWLQEEREETGGKPKFRYRINPKIYARTPPDPSAVSANTPADPPFGTNGTDPPGRFHTHEAENEWGEV